MQEKNGIESLKFKYGNIFVFIQNRHYDSFYFNYQACSENLNKDWETVEKNYD